MNDLNPADVAVGVALGVYLCVQLYCMRHLFNTKD